MLESVNDEEAVRKIFAMIFSSNSSAILAIRDVSSVTSASVGPSDRDVMLSAFLFLRVGDKSFGEEDVLGVCEGEKAAMLALDSWIRYRAVGNGWIITN